MENSGKYPIMLTTRLHGSSDAHARDRERSVPDWKMLRTLVIMIFDDGGSAAK